MDQFFDRLGDLLKSALKSDDDDIFSRRSGATSSRGTGDPDLDAAFEELNDFLNEGAAADARKASARQQAYTAPKKPAGPPEELKEDYKTLGVAFGAPFPEVKTAYKRLLKQYHPDKNADNPEKLRIATELTQKYNMAYQRVETWVETGKL